MNHPWAPKEPGCVGCPAFHTGLSFVPPLGLENLSTAEILYLGQGPGREEAWQRAPFQGPSGKELTRWRIAAGVAQVPSVISNVTWCWLRTGASDKDKDRAPRPNEIAHCRSAHWQHLIDNMPRLRLIVCVGVEAAKAFLPNAKASWAGAWRDVDVRGNQEHNASSPNVDHEVPHERSCGVEQGAGGARPPCMGGDASDSRGATRGGGSVQLLEAMPGDGEAGHASSCAGARSLSTREVEGRTDDTASPNSRAARDAHRRVKLLIILHPAFILRGQHALARYQVAYLERAGAYLRGEWEPEDATVPHPLARLSPTVPEMIEWLDTCRGAAFDIESLGSTLIMIGFWDTEDPERGGLCVPLRGERGVPMPYSLNEWRALVAALYRFLADPTKPKGAHNGQAFDIWVLERLGFKVSGYAWDTILMLHVAEPERKKDLQTAAVALCGAPAWKYLVRDDAQGEGK